MAQVFYDRVKETATVTGTSNPYALAGAETSYQAFGAVLTNGATCFYCAVGRTSNSWETGLGTYTTSGNTLARTVVQESSNSNSAVNWGSETIDIFLTQTATVANNTPTNNTSASSDYTMAVGETAYITYSSATSVALHIATVSPGEYEIIVQAVAATPVSDANAALLPNNTTYSNAISTLGWYERSATTTNYFQNADKPSFDLGATNLVKAIIRCSTTTNSKSVISSSWSVLTATNGGMGRTENNQLWNDTTTAWTSLGTIAFPYALSGTVLIRRIF